MNLDAAFAQISTVPGGPMRDRLMGQLNFALRLNKALGGKYDSIVDGAIRAVAAANASDGALTASAAREIETMLLPLSADSKRYKLILCGHAHIDMNWMWRYDETVQITLDTFQTVLDLMDEFPTFTFAQSQASVYRIVEEFAPQMLEQIAARVREGRWEVTASTWVEADRNMPTAEAVARHHLYTSRYLPKLIGAPECRLDYEPDTFGHHQNTPELLNQAGVKYYYHCRGLNGHTLYRWRAPSGAEVISYCEPFWYNGEVDASIADYVPEFCERFGVTTALRVYGVGDHGGGPTRRDVRRALDMMEWPVFPTIVFGKYHEFYDAVASSDKLPLVDREMNPLFVGCYTTQARIKKGNRYGERMLAEAEALSALAHAAAGAPYRRDKFEEGWRNVLFNQFHDILPGSGVPDTREYAMGLYQQAYAVANSARRDALRAIAGRIDTSAFTGAAAEPYARGQGAGVGFGVEKSLNLAQIEVGGGAERLFHLFNACAFERSEIAEVVLWDYPVDEKRLAVYDERGEKVRWQLLDQGKHHYWGHFYTRLLIEARVPAMGYATYRVALCDDQDLAPKFFNDWRVEVPEPWSIENGLVRLTVDPAANVAIELVDLREGGSRADARFSLVQEDASRGMTAWVTGNEVSDENAWGDVTIKRTARGPLYNELTIESKFGAQSGMKCTVGLMAGSDQVVFDAECHFLEVSDGKRIPQLRFDAWGDECGEFLYDIPGGVLKRPSSTIDLPGLRFVAGAGLALLTDSKYGYRGDEGAVGVTLIRNSTDPDRYPELGIHHFKLALAACPAPEAQPLIRRAQAFNSPLTSLSGRPHAGDLPLRGSLLKLLAGTVEINAVKLAEDGDELIVRGVELAGDGKGTAIELFRPIASAAFADTRERPIAGAIEVSGSTLKFDARPYGMFTIRVALA
ncbi:MAG: alpha-mannosidase [Clostridiales bacterium]|nr:alpha-mannosidase [Clostridiales bacterium]